MLNPSITANQDQEMPLDNLEGERLTNPSMSVSNENQGKMIASNSPSEKGSQIKSLYKMKLPIESKLKSLKESHMKTCQCLKINKEFNKLHLTIGIQEEREEVPPHDRMASYPTVSKTSLNNSFMQNEHYYYVSENSNGTPVENSKEKRKQLQALKKFISKQWKVAELKTSAYISACCCLSTLVPFPFFTTERNELGRKELKVLNSSIPKVMEMDSFLDKSTGMYQHEAIVKILHWLLLGIKNPTIVSVPEERLKEIISKVGPQNPAFQALSPFLYKIMWHVASPIELEWQTETAQFNTRFAFLGCPYEYIHSVMHYGLYPNLRLTGYYGTGFYLTDNLEVALKMCSFAGDLHKASNLNRRAVLVVEFCDNSKVSIKTEMSIDDIFCLDESVCQKRVTWYYSFIIKCLRVRYIMLFFDQEKEGFKKEEAEDSSMTVNDLDGKKSTSSLFSSKTLMATAASALLINTAAFFYKTSNHGLPFLGKALTIKN